MEDDLNLDDMPAMTLDGDVDYDPGKKEEAAPEMTQPQAVAHEIHQRMQLAIHAFKQAGKNTNDPAIQWLAAGLIYMMMGDPHE